jgi:hypothetical protein
MEEAHPYSFIAYNVIKDMILDEVRKLPAVEFIRKVDSYSAEARLALASSTWLQEGGHR